MRKRRMDEPEIAEIFKYKRYTCVIVRCISYEVTQAEINKPKIKSEFTTVYYHNGYVKTEFKFDYNELNEIISTTELTYSGTLEYIREVKLMGRKLGIDGWFIGFDTLHYMNIKNPKTQTQKTVKEELKRLCDELIGKKHLLPNYIAIKI